MGRLGKLSMEGQLQQLEDLIEAVRRHFGELGFAELPELQHQIELLFLWSGCGMHKDLNTFKAGATCASGKVLEGSWFGWASKVDEPRTRGGTCRRGQRR